MAKKIKALINFSRLKDDVLMVLVNTIIRAMGSNSFFSDPEPSLESIGLLLDDFSTKLTVARKRGSPEDTALKNESRIPLEDALQRLAFYVNTTAQGQLSVVLSSGFPTNSPTSGILIPTTITGVRLRDGMQKGQVRLDFDGQVGSRIYEFCYRQVNNEEEQPWSDRLMTTSSKGNILAPLPTAKEFEVIVRAINTKGIGDWSDRAKIMVR